MHWPKNLVLRVIAAIILLFGVFTIYSLPPVQAIFGWRVAELFARFKYALSPPEEIVFVPEIDGILPSLTNSPESSLSVPLSVPPTQIPATRQRTSSPAAEVTPIPKGIQLAGFRPEYQTWNNCGPATLAIALSYWGWEGDQRPIAAFTKPNSRDKNVMPYELAAYVEEETQLKVIFRVGGDVALLKLLLAAGFPIIIEKGFEGREFDGWMGHYVLVTGYSDVDQRFTFQDSYYGPDQVMGYEDLETFWRAFNFTYLVTYPTERMEGIKSILDQQLDEGFNYRYAAQKAANDIDTLTGRDLFFAWFNRGTNLVQLQDYAGAAAAYDQAFALYPAIPKKNRPWRIMWYQTGPYWAYYYTQRYQDVINLATTTLEAMSEPVLEESYYWRALAYEALGEEEKASKELRSALDYHPGFEPALLRFQQMGIAP